MFRAGWWHCVGLGGLVISSLASASQEVVIYSDDSYPPYAYRLDNKAVGIYPDLIRLAAEQLPDYRVIVQPITWKRGLSYLETGAAFALIPPYQRAARRFLSYSVPIGTESMVIFCLKERMPSGARVWPESFKDLRIGYNYGFLPTPNFRREVARVGMWVEEGHGNKTNLEKLARKRIDCYINDETSTRWTLRDLQKSASENDPIQTMNLELAAKVGAVQAFIGYSTVGAAAMRPYRQDFIQKMDEALRRIKASGGDRQIVRRYTGVAASP